MAKITIDNLAHSYLPNPKGEEDFALKALNLDWADGEAYALLGASGCGKSTLLNIISGLLHQTHHSLIDEVLRISVIEIRIGCMQFVRIGNGCAQGDKMLYCSFSAHAAA